MPKQQGAPLVAHVVHAGSAGLRALPPRNARALASASTFQAPTGRQHFTLRPPNCISTRQASTACISRNSQQTNLTDQLQPKCVPVWHATFSRLQDSSGPHLPTRLVQHQTHCQDCSRLLTRTSPAPKRRARFAVASRLLTGTNDTG